MSAPQIFKNLKMIKKLENNLKENSKTPIGELTLWQGDKLITNDNTFQFLGIFYLAGNSILEKYPKKSGYKRKYKMLLEFTDNKPEGGIFIRLSDAYNNTLEEITFDHMQGDVLSGFRLIRIEDFNLNIEAQYHIQLYATPDWATGGQCRLYKLSILVYDELE